MEKLTILRMFFCFPLLGFLVPDAGIFLSKNQGDIPMIHFIIEVALGFCILICTAVIAYKKRHQNHVSKTNGASFY